MAENLLSNNIEFSNQMYLPEEEDDSDIIIMRDQNNANHATSNFSNPVYDSMFGKNEHRRNEQRKNEQQQELLVDTSAGNEDPNEDPEAVDLLTERHRGNIEL